MDGQLEAEHYKGAVFASVGASSEDGLYEEYDIVERSYRPYCTE